MIRDNAIASLLRQRLSARDAVRRDAATVLLDLCRDGMSDSEIAAALDNAVPHMPQELSHEIRVVAEETGISLLQNSRDRKP